ncbi:phage tail tube protein [Streptosporangium vulgare]|uniref:Phage tail protein n=1 Tax=Streptosporangium vulgare TaxID=46190 RepID=A0ABV5TQ04_9ACTN
MAKRLTDGNTKATFVPAVASISAPTVAELTDSGLVALENTVTDDGLDISFDEGTVEGNVLASTQDFESPGRSKAAIELTYYRDSSPSSDRMWSVMTRGTAGFLIVRRGVAAGTGYAAGDKVEVYEVTCGERKPMAPERESYEKVQLKLYASGTYSVESVVAA